MKRTHIWLLAVVLMVFALASFIGAGRIAPFRGPTVAFVPEAAQAVAVLACAPGTMEYRPGARVPRWKGIVCWSGSESLQALREGKADFALMDPATAITAYLDKKDIVVLTNTAWSGTVLMGRANDGLMWVRDLDYRTVSIPAAGETQDVLLRYQMALHGLRPTDRQGHVTIEVDPVVEILKRFRDGTVDAACLPEPWGSSLQKTTGGVVLAGSGEMFHQGMYPSALLVARKDKIMRDPEWARRVAREAGALADAMNRDRQAIAPFLARQLQALTQEELSSSILEMSMKRCRYGAKVTIRDLRLFSRMMTAARHEENMPSLDGILWE